MSKISTIEGNQPGQRGVRRDFPEEVTMRLRSEMKVSWVRRK